MHLRELERLATQTDSLAALDHGTQLAEMHSVLLLLRASRRDAFEAANAARRAVERNLHDGAQQSLVALLYELSLARARFSTAGDRASERIVTAAAETTAQVLDDLRRIAHGAFPRVLDDLGLAAAIQTMVERSSVPVEVDFRAHGRLSAPVEHVAYLTAAASVHAAEAVGSPVKLSISHHQHQLRVAVVGAAMADLGDLGDRIEDLGGTIECRGRFLTMEVPCA